MRKIKKTIKVCDVEVLFYDRAAKEEKTEIMQVSELEKKPSLPEHCLLIKQVEIPNTEKEVVYSMTVEDFIKHAKADK